MVSVVVQATVAEVDMLVLVALMTTVVAERVWLAVAWIVLVAVQAAVRSP